MDSTNNWLVNFRAERGKQEEHIFTGGVCFFVIPPAYTQNPFTLSTQPSLYLYLFVDGAIFNKCLRQKAGKGSVKITHLSKVQGCLPFTCRTASRYME